MADFFNEILQKKDSEHCMFLSPQDLNDSKWLQMTSNDFKWLQMTVDLLDT